MRRDGGEPVLRGEALHYDIKQVLGLPRLPDWLRALPPDDEALARHWASVRAFAASPELDEAANELRRQALAWAEPRVERACDLELLPRLGYPAVDILWLQEGVEAYFASLPRLLLVCGHCQYVSAAGNATKEHLGPSHMGWSRTSGATLVLQDMQRTLRVPMLPPEWELLGNLPTYLYHLWPSLRAVLRDAESQAERQAAAAASITSEALLAPPTPNHQPPAPVRVAAAAAHQSLPLQFLLITVVALRLGKASAEYSRARHGTATAHVAEPTDGAETTHGGEPTLGREPTHNGDPGIRLEPAHGDGGPGLDGTNGADTGHNTQQTARGRDPAPCHT